jgi:excisionase family DNA binding protein
MEVGYFLTPTDFDKLMNGLVQKTAEVVAKMKTIEDPITKTEAAKYLKITYRTLNRKIDEGVIPTSLLHRIDGTILLYKSELEAYVKSL